MKQNKSNLTKNVVIISQLGFSMASPIIIFIFIGKLIEQRVNTNGIIYIVAIILGTIISCIYVYGIISKIKS